MPHPIDRDAESTEFLIDRRVEAAARGDRAAQEELLRELLPRVRNLVRYLVRGDDDVDDIAQQVLIALLRGFGSYRGEGKLSSWADRITARETFAYLRRERAQRKPRDLPAAELYVVTSNEGKPDEYLMRREAVKLLDQLPVEQRQALVLHHVVGMSVPEIAAALSTPEETTRSRLRLGMKKLRERYPRDSEDAR